MEKEDGKHKLVTAEIGQFQGMIGIANKGWKKQEGGYIFSTISLKLLIYLFFMFWYHLF